MALCTAPSVVLRRVSYGDYDLILTVLTPEHGKCTLIAKAAKKSVKRFGGLLEPFANLTIVFNERKTKGMPVLQEASMLRPFTGIRADILKTAYASYWTELVYLWIEEAQPQPEIYQLLTFVLGELAEGSVSPMDLSVLFQMRFLGQEGFRPVLEKCSCCQTDVGEMPQDRFCIDLTRGGIVCDHCHATQARRLHISKGTLKQLQWTAKEELSKARRIRFTRAALVEATRFLEAFVPYHFGRRPKSLAVLQQVRDTCTAPLPS